MNANNDSNRFENEFLKKMRENQMWEKMSRSNVLPWSEKLIDKYADQWNWEELSNNSSIPWNESLIERYKSKFDWKMLSKNCFSEPPTSRKSSFNAVRSNDEIIHLLGKFNHFWHWDKISRYAEFNFTPEIIEAFANRWVWKELIDNGHINWDYQLFERFRVFTSLIDIYNLTQSNLWSCLVDIDVKIISGKMLSE